MVDLSDQSQWDLLRRRIERMDPGLQSAPSVDKHVRVSRRLRLIILAPLAILLVWEVITRSLVAYLADVTPEIAIHLQSTNPTALVNLARGKLNSLEPVVTPASKAAIHLPSDPKAQYARARDDSLIGADPQTTSQIRLWSERAVLNDPLNANAFRILGQLSEANSDENRTKRLMQAAARRSPLERRAVFWMMRKSFQDQDYPLGNPLRRRTNEESI